MTPQDAAQPSSPATQEPPSLDTQVQETAELDPQAVEERGLSVSGFLRSRYWGRRTGEDVDHDLINSLSLDVGDARRDPFSAHVHAYLGIDLDDENDPAFQSISDTFDGVDGRLSQAYVAANDILGGGRAQLGRQLSNELPVLVWFDGLAVETGAAGTEELRAGAYGGVPVHVFESSADGNSVVGAFVEGRPWDTGLWRLDYLRFEEESLLGGKDNDLWYVNGTQALFDATSLQASYSYLDDESRDYRVTATSYHADTDFMLRASFFELLQTQGNLALEINPLFQSLLDLFPYTQLSLLASKGVAEWLQVEAGLDARNVSDSDDVGEFNRDFERYFLSTTFLDFPARRFDLTLTGDVYDGPGNEIQTWGADLSHEVSERVEASIGSYYSLYQYDLFLQEERDNVRVYYARLEYEPVEALAFDIDYQYESSDIDDYQRLRVGLTWRF